MKKIILISYLFFLTIIIKGNIATPKAFISELAFDSFNNWTLEIGFYEYSISEIDSIRIFTSSGSSIVTSFKLIKGYGYPGFDSLAIITNSNLLTPLTINPNGDFVKLLSYVWKDKPFDYVSFGNYEGSFLNCIRENESISYQFYIQSAGYTGSFCIDKSPTIGVGNDTTGALGNFSGKIYNPSGDVFTDGFFEPDIHNTTIHINPDGSFNERIFSRNYKLDTIEIYFPPWPFATKKYSIEATSFCLRPDSSYQQNIITKSIITNISIQECDYSNVFVSPNPFSCRTSFYFNFNSKKFNSTNNIRLLICSLKGQQLADIKMLSTQKKYDWCPTQKIPSGILVYNLQVDGVVIAKGKFLKQ